MFKSNIIGLSALKVSLQDGRCSNSGPFEHFYSNFNFQASTCIFGHLFKEILQSRCKILVSGPHLY
jgi:hypothetical protein